MSDFVEDGVMGEDGWGSRCFNSANMFAYVADKKERKAKAKREQARRERWQRAMAMRADWTPEDFAAEEARLRAEIEAWADRRDAA
ncbi:hypothetical protein SAMN05421853_11095 [Roseivivax halotolerans]|uniref:Uncharacterized protein n=1 Tax=Roseivivax halotolerans TaxID=93684 RepID=A0A1I5ZJ68_9RHOB|nr:hypothetical protein [Roseivivax halotolerans]SFQ56522.1 hypothetical protein SAMN05421853_11095 [Roseivivax halotolerans]